MSRRPVRDAYRERTLGLRCVQGATVLTMLLAVALVCGDLYEAWQEQRAARAVPRGPGEIVEVSPPSPGDQLRPYGPRVWPAAPRRNGTARERPAFDPDEERMRFRLATTTGGERAVIAAGPIAAGTAAAFRAFREAHELESGWLVLISPGGRIQEALDLGDLLRADGWRTAVPAGGFCHSSCPLVLAAGGVRLVAEDALIGLHQAYLDDQVAARMDTAVAIADIQAVNGMIIERLEAWGTAPVIWTKALATPKDLAYVLTTDELTESGLATGIEDLGVVERE
jgi:hypothetical protein